MADNSYSDYSDSDADEPEFVKIVLKKRKRVVDSDKEEHDLDEDDSADMVRAIFTSCCNCSLKLYMTSQNINSSVGRWQYVK
jgi:hypothetical protein